ncbi:MAG: FAD-dependent oxidoreductase [Gammaproteobacteria bacterium]|uniref:NAD(P)/FAD-dependent oxidoreductase n=1 Tax=Rhodoferax sp. TaxID=50421 RepID=UPI0017ADAD36|nr:FAD-dependent oxidoreductase [Rhodoferax sp.]MBU3898476.1 FAD-dependent oxidoreductase [Gammaproteobacteria bacterium]MBA3058503.1 FAD-dependent oxidoreductase [Rhodoferax sp.]MBU3997803.1 FAD-dependent oxidoreductase [Gammaproteobacteria bacterium]MBU4079250.1 FAD-dependent oxidoreductase [Gammaproteobacteria bacterium]MBU4112195.1 FAD-dependent oxidoreductase [Gammaproteobacteria bacterium]
MIRLSELKLALDHTPADLQALVLQTLGIAAPELAHWQIFKRSFDARQAQVRVVYIVDAALSDPAREGAVLQQHAAKPHIQATPDMAYHLVAHAPADLPLRPVVVGFGPCGIFAALMLAQMGFKPIVLERGKKVRERTQDTWGLWRKHVLNPESNVQFGEGGAGTFSDGKLWSQIKDPRYLGRKVMEEFVKAGAPPEILVDAHPHIGTFKLVKVVENLRAQIITLGGEIRFEQRVTDLQVEGSAQGRQVRALSVLDQATGQSYELRAEQVVLALGHSARDTFATLHERGVTMQAKPFSVGFRVEHPQSVIDRARWGRHAGHPSLGAADYKLVHHARNGRAVYSFCMCPGGTVVAATSEPGRVVTNGMSQYSRNERNANAGVVVGIEAVDYPLDDASFIQAFGPLAGTSYAQEAIQSIAVNAQAVHPLAGINLQRQLESGAYVLGGSNYEAPAQLVGDFIEGKASTSFGGVLPSYQPGVKLGDLHPALPHYAIAALREALPAFGQKIKGFDMPDAVLTGVETRTSSPLRMPRGDDFQSVNTRGLYPAGEGAGYAGGILSAGVDGIKVAEALAKRLTG